MMGREILLVVQKGDHSLGYYDFATGEELARIALDPYPHEFALSRDGHYAYCCHFGVALAEDEGAGGNTVSVVDIPARKRVATIDCGDFRRPHDAAMDGKGTLYVLSEGTSNLLVIPDPLAGRIGRVLPTGGEGSHILSVTRDGRMAFCSNMASGTVTAVFPDDPYREPVAFEVGLRPEGSVLDERERRLYTVVRENSHIAVIDVPTLRPLPPIPTPPGPVRIAWGPDGRLLVPLYHHQGLALIDPRKGVREVVPLPDKPISIGSHGPYALCSTFGDRVCVVDTRTAHLVRAIRTRSDPDPVAVVTL